MELKFIRKTVRLKSSLYLCLPYVWVEAMRLEPKQEIQVIMEDDGSLKIAPIKEVAK